ncbi:TRAF3-interacting protein 1-like [Penaeus indicus]|uniref:TRAF3-interacting protein 1-like n=1 Tax=Penaeus indicus TaxID=29960 RepID=UPI00300D7D62
MTRTTDSGIIDNLTTISNSKVNREMSPALVRSEDKIQPKQWLLRVGSGLLKALFWVASPSSIGAVLLGLLEDFVAQKRITNWPSRDRRRPKEADEDREETVRDRKKLNETEGERKETEGNRKETERDRRKPKETEGDQKQTERDRKQTERDRRKPKETGGDRKRPKRKMETERNRKEAERNRTKPKETERNGRRPTETEGGRSSLPETKPDRKLQAGTILPRERVRVQGAEEAYTEAEITLFLMYIHIWERNIVQAATPNSNKPHAREPQKTFFPPCVNTTTRDKQLTQITQGQQTAPEGIRKGSGPSGRLAFLESLNPEG